MNSTNPQKFECCNESNIIDVQKDVLDILGIPNTESKAIKNLAVVYNNIINIVDEYYTLNIDTFLVDFEKCNDIDINMSNLRYILKYIDALKKLHECNTHIRKYHTQKIFSLKKLLKTTEAKCARYISHIEEKSNKYNHIKKKNSKLIRNIGERSAKINLLTQQNDKLGMSNASIVKSYNVIYVIVNVLIVFITALLLFY